MISNRRFCKCLGKQALALLVITILNVAPVCAHDTWVETNTNAVRVNDAIYVDLCLGNHGNDHRDFKLAGKIDLKDCRLDIVSPSANRTDMIGRMIDMGSSPKDGFWRAKYVGSEPGLHLASHTCEKLVNHGRPLKSVKSGKAFFSVSASLDELASQKSDLLSPIGHALEIVPLVNPATSLAPGKEIGVQVLFKGKPLAAAEVTFVPRGEVLKPEFDDRYQRKTDVEGKAFFTPDTGNQILVVVHLLNEKERGTGYEATSYSATMTLFVPALRAASN